MSTFDMTTGNQATFSMILAQLLNDEMRDKNWTQKEFLEQSGISTASWSRISRGQSSFSMEDLRTACHVLGVDSAKLITEAEDVVAGLPDMDVQVVHPVGPSNAAKYAGVFIAAAALAFLISRIIKR
jgi:transcriptional regulator with XRE-family HTH domain